MTKSKNTKQLSIGFICNYSVDLHFPVHFYGVYDTLLTQKGYQTDIVAFFREENADMTRQMRKRGMALISNYRDVSLINRLKHSVTVTFKLINFFLSRPLLRNADIYVVHNDPLLGWLTYIWGFLNNRPVIYRITHLMPEQAMGDPKFTRRAVGKIAKQLRNWLIPRCTMILPMSSEMANTLEKQVGKTKNQMLPLESTVNVDDIAEQTIVTDSQESCINDIKRKMADFPCSVWLVYIGTLSPFRKPTFLFETLAKIRQTGINAGLLVLGIAQAPWHLDRLKSFAEKIGVKDVIHWNEGVPEQYLSEAIALADIGLSPFPVDAIMRNNSPLKTLEYIKGGVPLVASPIPDHLYVVPNSGIGIVADFEPESFANACVLLLNESEEKRQNRIVNARKWLKKNRSLSYACERLETAFNLCLPHRTF